MISFGKSGYDEAGIKQSFITFYKILATESSALFLISFRYQYNIVLPYQETMMSCYDKNDRNILLHLMAKWYK